MKIKLFLIMIISFSTMALGEINIKINEPIRFKDMNTRSLGSDYLCGQGSFEVYTDNEEEDLGKKISFKFPSYGYISNKKNVVKVEKYTLEDDEDSMILSTKREIVKFYALVKKREINSWKEPEIIEGRYEGTVPVEIFVYKKVMEDTEK